MSDSVQNLIAEPEDKGTRIDKYLSQELEDVSRSRIQKLLDDGDIYLFLSPYPLHILYSEVCFPEVSVAQ